MLETLLSRSDIRENKEAQLETAKVVEQLVETFSHLDRDNPDFWTVEIITTSLDLILSAKKFYDLVLCALIRFVRILSHLPPLLLNRDAMKTLSKVSDRRGRNLLHEAIYHAFTDCNRYATVCLLLNAGCDPNAIDDDRNTPLHFLAQRDERYWFRDLDKLAHLLLDFGAQLGRKNGEGKTAFDLWSQKNGRYRSRNEDNDQGFVGLKLPDWCTELPTLASWSARVIRRNRIPYLKLPTTLIPFIEKHKLTQ